jgi:hypothetical protein
VWLGGSQTGAHAFSAPFLPKGLKGAWLRFQYRVRLVVESSAFNNLFLAAILGNSLVLAIEHDGMSAELEASLSHANLAFTALFCVELASKVLGLGPWTYLTDAWNCFDAVVVAVRWAAAAGASVPGGRTSTFLWLDVMPTLDATGDQ